MENLESKRGVIGRPRKFKTPESLYQSATAYFEWCNNNPFEQEVPSAGKIMKPKKRMPYTVEGLCVHIGLARSKYYEYKEGEDSFKDIVIHIDTIIKNDQYTGALVGEYNPLLVSRINGIADKQEIKSEGSNLVINVKTDALKEQLEKLNT